MRISQDILRKTGVICICAFLCITLCHAQIKNITGIVIDEESGEPLVGASVIVKGSQQGCISDLNGRFTFHQPLSEQQVLIVSYIGYLTTEVPVRHKMMEIRLRQDMHELDEVVVQVAYGTAQRKSITGAVSVVDSKQIEMRPVSSVTSVLNGLVPGVQIMDGIGQPGKEAEVRIRGYSSINGSNKPLFVVDGMPYTGWITDINPADVESVSVLKDAASCALYGSRASNGVILITTKKAKKQGVSLQLDIRHGFSARGQGDYKRMNANQFMEAMWQGYRNQLISNGSTPEEATTAANNELINRIGINIYNKADNALFDENGHLVADAQILDGYKDDLDWYSPYTRTGHRQEYNLSGESGNERNRVRFSLGYLDEDGYTKKSDFNRLSGLLSADFTPRLWLKTGLSLAGTHQKTNWDMGGVGSTQAAYLTNAFYFARRMAPIYPVHLHYTEDIFAGDGSLLHAKGDYILDSEGGKQYDDGSTSRSEADVSSNGHHLIWESEKNKLWNTANTLQANAYADVSFLRDFTFSLRGNISLRNTEDRQYDNAEIGNYKGTGFISKIGQKYKEYTLQEILTWKRSFGKHFIEWMAGHENYDYKLNFDATQKKNENFPGVDELSNFTTTTYNEGYKDTYRTEGYFTRARYDYNDTYFAEASFRRDGSSIFHTDHRWGNFWSAGVGWMLSNEAILKEVSWLDRLKLRFSYGQVGNDNFGSNNGLYQWMPLYGSTVNGGEAAYYKVQNENPELKWETNSSLNIGLETRLFNRVNLSFEYYDKRSNDLLFKFIQPLSAGATDSSTGLSTVWRNIGDVSNRGWEFSIDGDVFRNREWEWNVGLNLSKVKNKIGRLPDKDREEGIVNGDYQKFKEGHSIYEFWLYQYAGVDQMTGRSVYLPDFETYYIAGEDGKTPVNGEESIEGKNPIPTNSWVDINGQYYTGDPRYARKDWSGSSLPKINGSFQTSLRWKDLTLSALMVFSCGSKVLDQPYQALTSVGVHALSTDLQNAWNGIPEGMTETSPNRINPSGIPQVNLDATVNGYSNQKASTRYIVSGDYLSIKNITLAYRLPTAWSKRLTLGTIRVHAAVENAALFSKRKGLNPMQTFNGIVNNYASISRVFSFGVNINL
ncbi:TonB-dependent receptor [Bacteroides sp. GM023]|uniref:SusC/RagA family TonB-linked outer membrane protein n=1 Tax=Bacteroides sp. GM023 TaxID=2723058 RepID=UPI001CC2D465|nr:TonB-dependent receptor [Bacteroides sp. GM023]